MFRNLIRKLAQRRRSMKRHASGFSMACVPAEVLEVK